MNTNWQKVKLGEVMAGKFGSVDPSKFTEEIFDLYSIPAFDKGEPEIVAGSAIGSAKQVVHPGDVLLSKIVPHIRRSWIVGEERGRRIIASSEWIVFRSEGADPNYLRQILVGNPFHNQFMNTVAGVGGSLLRARPAHVAKIEIPLPPLEEQQRIASILDAADALRRVRRQSLALLDELAQSLFLELFGDPASNPKGWEVRKFAEIGHSRLGKMLDARKQTGKNPRRYLRNANVQWHRVDLSSIFEMDFDEKDRKTFRLCPGDLLICEGGEPGRAAIWKGEIEEIYYQKALHRVQVHADKATGEYLVYLLEIMSKSGLLADQVTSATIAHLTGEKLATVPIPLPPLPLQETFAAQIAELETIKTRARTQLLELDALFASLQERAFAGKL